MLAILNTNPMLVIKWQWQNYRIVNTCCLHTYQGYGHGRQMPVFLVEGSTVGLRWRRTVTCPTKENNADQLAPTIGRVDIVRVGFR